MVPGVRPKQKFQVNLIKKVHKCIILYMIKISMVVKRLFLESDTAQLAVAEGLLNVSEFARKIRPAVEKLAMKDVAEGTIRTALYRFFETQKLGSLKPKVVLSSLSVHPNLIDVTYEKAQRVIETVPLFLSHINRSQQSLFYTVTQGQDEITIIADRSFREEIINQFGQPKKLYQDLVAITVKFDEKYLTVPNMIYTLMASLAVKRVNVMELVSTLTSLTFIVDKDELTTTLAVLKRMLPNA